MKSMRMRRLDRLPSMKGGSLSPENPRTRLGLIVAISSLLIFTALNNMQASQHVFAATDSATSTTQPRFPNLGVTAGFGVVGSKGVSNIGSSSVAGNVGVGPGASVTGLPAAAVSESIHEGDAAAVQAMSDLANAYNAIANSSCTASLPETNLEGLTLSPGVYCFSSSTSLSGELTLNSAGNDKAVYIFDIPGSLAIANGVKIATTEGDDCDVFWRVGGTTSVGNDTALAGSILSSGNILMGAGTNITGSVMTQGGSVTMNANHIASQCAISTWRQQVSSFQNNAGQCAEVTYPSTAWESERCMGPDLTPLTVGGHNVYDDNGTQGSSYVIGEAEGEVASLTGFVSESDSTAGSNYYSIQDNTNYYRNSTWYDGTTMTSTQHYWEQFAFVNEALCCGSGYGEVSMQFWLINYLSNHSSCPTISGSWTSLTQYLTSGNDCWAPTYYMTTPEEDPRGLASYSLSGCISLCDASGYDSAIFCYSNTCDYHNVQDSILGFASHWTNVEWNVLGKSLSTADFSGSGSSGADIHAKVYLWDSSDNTHSESSSETYSTTAESNNLNLYSWDSGYTGYYDFTECQTTPC